MLFGVIYMEETNLFTYFNGKFKIRRTFQKGGKSIQDLFNEYILMILDKEFT